MIAGGCLCGRLPQLLTQTRIVLVSHVAELARTTNTARLLGLMLPEATIIPRGGESAADRSPIRLPINDAGERRWLLFPQLGAPELTADQAHLDPRPLTLVVPDGSWPQARRAARRDPALAELPRWRLPEGPRTRFVLRDQRRSGQHLCTLEAVARALGIIEGHRIEAMLLAGLDVFTEQILASRGRLSGPQAIVRRS